MTEISRPLAICALMACAATRPSVAVLPAPGGPDAKLEHSVVAVRVTGQGYDWSLPWLKGDLWDRWVNGLVIEGRKLLLVGDDLANQTLVQVEKLGEAQRYTARVTLVDYEVPLALLEVDDEAFWEDLVPLGFAEELIPGSKVTVCRWSSGKFDTSEGTIRRLRSRDHGPGELETLGLLVSAEMDAGGWSEVVVNDEGVVALTAGKSTDGLSGIAAPTLKQFVDAANSGDYVGFARHGFSWQKLTNPALRNYLGLEKDEGGVLVRRVMPFGTGSTGLERGDVLLTVDGTKIDSLGNFRHPEFKRKFFFGRLFTDGRRPGDTISVGILRDKKRQTAELRLDRVNADQYMIPWYWYDRAPEYTVKGGLVFQSVTKPYLMRRKNWRSRTPLALLIAYDLESRWPTAENPRLVVLSHVLPDPANLGYQELRDVVVEAVNGVKVRTMDDLKAGLSSPKSGFHIIELFGGQSARRVVLDVKELDAAEPRIRARYGIQ